MCTRPQPWQLPQKNMQGSKGITVPCGRCRECKKLRATQWAFRIEQEKKRSRMTPMVTLTYDDDNVPWVHDQVTGKKRYTLQYYDITNFIKRVREYQTRKLQTNDKIKYYYSAEYGSKLGRPHYHIVFFNLNLYHLSINKRHDIISTLWGKGIVHIGQNNNIANAGYITHYTNKTSPYPRKYCENRGIQPEKHGMSQGFGDNYITRMAQWHQADPKNRYTVRREDGKYINMPRYYLERIFNKQDQLTIAKIKIKNYEDKQKDTKAEYAPTETKYFELQERSRRLKERADETTKQKRDRDGQ
jgi:hypothetical protein